MTELNSTEARVTTRKLWVRREADLNWEKGRASREGPLETGPQIQLDFTRNGDATKE